MDFLSLTPLVGVFMFAAGVRHARQEFGYTKDRMLNPPFLLLVLPALFTLNVKISDATFGQLLIFLCAFLGFVGAALSISTMRPSEKQDTKRVTNGPITMAQVKDA